MIAVFNWALWLIFGVAPLAFFAVVVTGIIVSAWMEARWQSAKPQF